MVCEPVSVYHEHPGQRLSGLTTRIALMRGSPIDTIGAADLLLRDADGAWRRILEADQTVYLHPRTTRPEGARIEVGSDTLPDVVLEVDNTTDVRRGKLALYESWGFPEVWVEVPEQSSPSRPAGLRPGLTIHLLEGGRFRTASSSRAFPSWTAQEIHLALNEREVSYVTMAALRRVARTLGAAVGTGPDDDPLLREERLQSHAEGRTDGGPARCRAAGAEAARPAGVGGVSPAPGGVQRGLHRDSGAGRAGMPRRGRLSALDSPQAALKRRTALRRSAGSHRPGSESWRPHRGQRPPAGGRTGQAAIGPVRGRGSLRPVPAPARGALHRSGWRRCGGADRACDAPPLRQRRGGARMRCVRARFLATRA